MDGEILSKAIVIYIGYGKDVSPRGNKDALRAAFGSDSDWLLIKIDEILNKLNSLSPDWRNNSLDSAGDWAKIKMMEEYPELNSSALEALKWSFTWWWR